MSENLKTDVLNTVKNKPLKYIKTETNDKIKKELNKLCGIADHISYTLADDETAEEIDKIVSNINKLLDNKE